MFVINSKSLIKKKPTMICTRHVKKMVKSYNCFYGWISTSIDIFILFIQLHLILTVAN